MTVEVRWRSGLRSIATNLPPQHLVELDETAAQPSTPIPLKPPAPWFEDQSSLLKHLHVDEPFDEFARQKLLPRKVSDLGPGVTWYDFNGDGWDDLMVGAGHGGKPAVFRNDTHGGFIPQRAGTLLNGTDRDLTTILGWRPEATQVVLLFGQSNYEDGRTNGSAVRRINLTTGAVDDSLTIERTGASALALGDVDGDGEPDLFVGGQVLPGRYPEGAGSRVFRSHRGRLEPDLAANRALAGVGPVSGAVFSDLDGDGRLELILAGEWGPLRIFRNQPSGLQPWDPPVKRATGNRALSELTGGWNSVTTGDFDNDGRMDLVAGNWGRNTRYQRFITHPLELHFADADGDGITDLLEAYFDPDEGKVVPARDWKAVSPAFPMLRDRYTSFSAFSTAGLDDLSKAGLPVLQRVTQSTLETLVFLNRGDHFEARALPFEAQVSPVFGLAVGDFDGDGHEDLFAAQNFSGFPPGESRIEAGQGVWLRGDGRGRFTAVSASESGLAVIGEGRGAAVSDFDGDGRLDLLVGQNRGPTRLFHNVRGQPGLRVRLKGSARNPDALGTRIRLIYRDGTKGPIREIRSGGGYWSQDSVVPVLGIEKAMGSLEIRWPDGVTQQRPVSEGAREITAEEEREKRP